MSTEAMKKVTQAVGRMRRIVTPRGRTMTPRAYLSLLRAQDRLAGAFPCVHGHISCAAWNGGPCCDELLSDHPELAE